MKKTMLFVGMVLAGVSGLTLADSLYVDSNGNVGVGTTTTPVEKRLLVSGTDDAGANTDNEIALKVQNLSTVDVVGGRVLAELVAQGNTKFQFSNLATGVDWAFANGGLGDFRISKQGTGGPELTLDGDGNLTILGSLTTGYSNYPDYVFKDSYKLMPVDELAQYIKTEGHLPNVQSEKEVIENGGVDISKLQTQMLQKIEELTLYTIEQHEQIQNLQTRLIELESSSE